VGQIESPVTNLILPGLIPKADAEQLKIENQRKTLGYLSHMMNLHGEWPVDGIECIDAVNEGSWEMMRSQYPYSRSAKYASYCSLCRYYLNR
jgi:hypothetical protein